MRRVGKIFRWIVAAIAVISVFGGLFQLGGAQNQAGVIAVIVFWVIAGGLALYFEKRSNDKRARYEK